MDIVEAKDLKKTYKGGVKAVKGVSFNISEGEVFGFLGPNGAGKTTTIKMLTTLLKPTDGSATVAGFDVAKRSNLVRESIGIVFQEPALDIRLTGRENLDFHARLYGIPRDDREKRITQVLKLVDMEKFAGQLVVKYSGGMKRRLEIARGLMHKPRVLFLDEPTLGLDVQTRRKIWEYLERVKDEENMTIFLTTHYMEEAEKVCDRIAIIDDGKILKIGTPDELMSNIRDGGVIVIQTDKSVGKIKGVRKKTKKGKFIELEVENRKEIPGVVKQLLKDYYLEELSIRRSSLEDVFVKLTGKSLRDDKLSGKFKPGGMRRGH